MNKKFKVLLYVCLLTVGLVSLSLLVGIGWWLWPESRLPLPSEQQMRQQFQSRKVDYIQLVTLLKKDSSAKYVSVNGNTEYQILARKIGIKGVIIREDGSIEFALWGYGGTIEDDSYMGVRYFPTDHKIDSSAGWTQTVVTSLVSAKLPQENGSVATGLYVVAIEPEWFIYRFEYRE